MDIKHENISQENQHIAYNHMHGSNENSDETSKMCSSKIGNARIDQPILEMMKNSPKQELISRKIRMRRNIFEVFTLNLLIMLVVIKNDDI